MLQRFDLKLMDLEEEKGDLPGIARNLTDQLHELQSRIDQLQREINDHITTRTQSTLDAESLNERVESLKKQLYQVRNNKEYDAITKELNDAESGIIKKLQAAEEHESKQKELQTVLHEITDKFGMLKNELAENQHELQSVSKIHEKEELSLRHERDKIARRIPEDTLLMYDRIRFAKDGKAVVPIKRGACGGCYKTVPPQLNLLLRQNDEIHICENCGRILIAEEIAAEVNKVA
jgi:uncharacterized protein